MKTALILYPHQLYPIEFLPEVDTVFVVEDPLYFGVDEAYPLAMHKQKLILHRASMRRYVKEVLWPTEVNVEYIELDPLLKTNDLFHRAKHAQKIYVFDPVDDVLLKRILQARREHASESTLELLSSPNFFLPEQDVRQYLTSKEKHDFDDFYQWQRERFNILINTHYKPVGGKWSLESDTHTRLPKGQELPSFEAFGSNEFVSEATAWVEKYFPKNPGGLDFIWPTNHAEATAWLEDFVENRLDNFGPYEDTIDGQAPWLYHSVLGASLNIGLLSPQQVVTAALDRHEKRAVPLPSLESFVQQILGWREYVRGLYVCRGAQMRTKNVLANNRQLTSAWYDGTLGIPPFDDMVLKLQKHGYAHHAERLMIAGNLMLLSEIHPNDVYRWFSEMLVDAYDWVTVPNIYGISQFADGGQTVGKPNVSSSHYILTMSNYEKGEWSDVWDGLFWRFIEKHRTLVEHNPQMRMFATQLDSLDPDRKRIITYRAEDFLKRYTK